MFSIDAIARLHVEPTTRCNLRCPMCPRTGADGRPNRRVPPADLELSAFTAIVEPLVDQLEELLFCGNYGDPMVATDLLPMVAWLRRRRPDLRVLMHTNGSGRDSDFWRALARADVRIRFGIDGLEDTLGRYRRGADYDRVMASAAAFIAAGGRATWQLIAFRHNERQIDEARRRADALGFRRFEVKPTGRFAKARHYPRDAQGRPDYTQEPTLPVYAGSDLVDRLAPPRAASLRRLPTLTSMHAHRRSLQIDCRALRRREIYLSAERLVLPCCWLGELYASDRRGRRTLAALAEAHGGLEALRAPDRSIREIVAGPLYASIARGWSGADRLETCVRACGLSAADERAAVSAKP